MAEADVASPSLGLCPRGERGYEWGVMASRGSLECTGLSPSAHPLCPFPLAVICAYAGLGGEEGAQPIPVMGTRQGGGRLEVTRRR